MESVEVTRGGGRQASLALTLQAVVREGRISRAAVAKQTGLSKQTVSETMRALEDSGWVRETGRTTGHVGRSAATYELVPDSAFIVAVDLGGTKLRLGISDLSGTFRAYDEEPTDPAGGQAVAQQIARLLRRAAGTKGLHRVLEAVVGCPGVPDELTGEVCFAPNIPGLDIMDFRAAVAAATGLRVRLENDVNLSVLGERWLGAGRGCDDLAFVALGTGLGAGIMVRGELLRGASGAAGEIGYLPFGADPFEPESLRVGALERELSTQGLRAAYRARTGRELEVPAIFDAADAGDAAADAVLQEVARMLARAVAALAAVTNPQLVILGGSIGARPELLHRVRAELPHCHPFPPAVERTILGENAALAGAAAVGLQRLPAALFPSRMAPATMPLPDPRDRVEVE